MCVALIDLCFAYEYVLVPKISTQVQRARFLVKAADEIGEVGASKVDLYHRTRAIVHCLQCLCQHDTQCRSYHLHYQNHMHSSAKHVELHVAYHC
jgi:hypothetical protein